MGRDELACEDIWSSDWVWLNASHTKKATHVTIVCRLFLSFFIKNNLRFSSFSDDLSLGTNGIKTGHFIILDKINITTTAMTDQLNMAIC